MFCKEAAINLSYQNEVKTYMFRFASLYIFTFERQAKGFGHPGFWLQAPLLEIGNGTRHFVLCFVQIAVFSLENM